MTDAQYTTLPQWPNAYPASGASATLKRLNEDFIVTELPLQLPAGEGEHIWLEIEKNGANTAFVAQQLAVAASVQERDVGYAGLKDPLRHHPSVVQHLFI
jgi:tRNA pseudouridine13 synthase